MIELKSHIWSMIVKRRIKACFKIEIIIWWKDDFAQALSKNVKLSNIINIAFMHCNNKYNYNRLHDDFAYNIFNLTFSLYYVKYW